MNKIRLSKFAFDEKYPISDLVNFLNENGYKKKEDHNELISEDEIQFIKNNFNSYLQQKNGGYDDYKNNFLKNVKKKNDVKTPVQLKIIEAASKEKLLVERIIGFTDFKWDFLITKFNGKVSQPVPFNIIDEIVCDLLLVDNLSKKRIGEILGFNIKDNPAESAILEKTIKSLKGEKIIIENNDFYELSEIGVEYAKNGVKYSYFDRDFSIYFDLTGRNQEHAKVELKKLKSEKDNSHSSDIPINIEQIKEFAIFQAPEVHFPEKNFILQSASLVSSERFSAPLWAIFLENFKDNSSRVLVYDENQNKIIEQLSADLNKRDDFKAKLFENLVQNSDEISLTADSKSAQQLEEENKLIEQQVLVDSALNNKNNKEVQKLKEEIKFQKRTFNSVEFELELKQIFETNNNELWFISPWLRYHAIRFRYNYFEQQLRAGAKIFIVYSEPESEGAEMVDPRAKSLLDELEKNYRNFYIHQLPKFHYKNVWIRNSNAPNVLYTGSFNILSFYVDTNSKNYRQEQMIKIDWDEETDLMYNEFIKQFGMKYILQEGNNFNNLLENVPEKINSEYLNKIKTIDNIKLNTFRNIGFDNFDQILENLEEKKNEALQEYGKPLFIREVYYFNEKVNKLLNMKINRSKKKEILDDFESLVEEFNYLKDAFNNELSDLRKSIAKLKTIN